MLNYLIIFTSALIFSMLFTFLLAKFSLKNKILKTNDIPLVGGVGIGLAFIFALSLGIFTLDLSLTKISAIAVASLAMLFFGVIDDLRELSIVHKLLVQSICAVYLISCGIKTEIMYLGFWGNAVITFFWLLGVTNAFNLLDILDGLTTGLVLIISSAFLLIGFLSADLNVQILSLILCASSSGFLFFNFPPAKVYLGNSGSHFFGLLLAAIALIAHYASEGNVFALVSPVMILGLPIMDTALLIIFRVIKKKLPFNKSKDHVVLKIKALGFSPVRVLLIMYLLCFIFSACGVVLTRASNLMAIGIIIAVCLFSIGVLPKLIKIEVDG
ncbi:MAG: MraY family glycosyltransferase [Candidatus Omnitrophota bacterium]|nr:MraY family glycosyltransferase [Candidatus Omnitrophota bacterium]